MDGRGAHDFSNNPLQNWANQNISTDDERGLPVIGKQVFDLRDNTLYVCVDTDPDPTLNGGGTWEPVAGAGGFTENTTGNPVLKQGSTTFTLSGSSGESEFHYAVSPPVFHAEFGAEIASGTGTSGQPVLLEIPDFDQSFYTPYAPLGVAWAAAGGVYTPLFVYPYDFVSTPKTVCFRPISANPFVASLYGAGISLVANDMIYGQFSTLSDFL